MTLIRDLIKESPSSNVLVIGAKDQATLEDFNFYSGSYNALMRKVISFLKSNEPLLLRKIFGSITMDLSQLYSNPKEFTQPDHRSSSLLISEVADAVIQKYQNNPLSFFDVLNTYIDDSDIIIKFIDIRNV